MIDISSFKAYFKRDFPYLPLYVATKTYFKDDIVYSENNFYQSLIDNNTNPLTDTESWKVVKGDENEYILDEDIQKAIDQSKLKFPISLFDENERDVPQLFLIAFYLVLDFKCSSSGVSGNSASMGFVSSKSVGSVSESYSLPSWAQNDPNYSIYSSNPYGLKYLSYLMPKISLASLGFLSQGSTTL